MDTRSSKRFSVLLVLILLKPTSAFALQQDIVWSRGAKEADEEDPQDAAAQVPEQAPANRTDDRSIDEIYRDIFGRDRPPAVEDIYPVFVDGVNVGQFRVRPDEPTRDGAIEARFVADILTDLTIGDTRAVLSRYGEQESVSFAELADAGLSTRFDASSLSLHIDIPIDVRGIRNLDLRSLRTREYIEYVQQADISGYLSVRAGAALVEHSRVTGAGFDDLVAAMDFAVNVKGVVLEAELDYDQVRDSQWERGDVRLTYDDLDNLIRFEAGDLSIGSRPSQGRPRIGGIAAFRNYGIDPYRNIRPVPSQSFVLDQPARVELLLNGLPLRTFDLPSGNFNLRNFSLIPSAANDIELRVTYATGETEILSFPAYFDLDLLAPGLFDFAVNLGLPYSDNDGSRVYDDNDYNVIAFARYGFSPTLSAGFNWQGNKDFDTVGPDIVWASPIGTFGINASTNIRAPGADSSQLTVQYRWRDNDRERDRSVDALISLTGEDYRTLNQLFGGNTISRQARVRAAQNLGEDGRVQLFAGYERDRESPSDRWYAGANYSHQFDFGSLSFGLEYQKDQRESVVARVAFSIPLGNARLSGNAITTDNAMRLDYSVPTPAGVGGFGYSAGIERRDGSDREFARLNYNSNRFEASIAQRAENYLSNRSRQDMRTEFTVGTAIVMADGHFGLGRPVRNSFAMIEPRAGAGDFDVAVEPRTGFASTETRYTAYSGSLGPAVVPSLVAYFNRSLQVDAPDAPAGISIGGQVYSVRPGYRSGYYIPVGDDRNVSIVGNMVDRNGEPIAFAVGLVEKLSGDDQAEPVQVFTNSTGRFFIEGVEAGESYSVVLTIGETTVTQTIDVPEDLNGIYSLEEPLYLDIDVGVSAPAEDEEIVS